MYVSYQTLSIKMKTPNPRLNKANLRIDNEINLVAEQNNLYIAADHSHDHGHLQVPKVHCY